MPIIETEKKRPKITPFEPYEIPGKSWGVELVIAHTPEYLGKILTMAGGRRGAMQFHQTKKETFFLYSGKATIRTKLEDGSVQEWPMSAGESYDVPPGAIHQVEAFTDCVFFECSTPVFDDRVSA